LVTLSHPWVLETERPHSVGRGSNISTNPTHFHRKLQSCTRAFHRITPDLRISRVEKRMSGITYGVREISHLPRVRKKDGALSTSSLMCTAIQVRHTPSTTVCPTFKLPPLLDPFPQNPLSEGQTSPSTTQLDWAKCRGQ
jgi:hypothetical protein